VVCALGPQPVADFLNPGSGGKESRLLVRGKFVLMLVSELDATIMPISMALINSSVSSATNQGDASFPMIWLLFFCLLIINVLLAGHRLVQAAIEQLFREISPSNAV